MITREQAKKRLVALGIAEPTEEQITTYLNTVNSDVQEEKDKADKYEAGAKKAVTLQKQIDDLEAQGLSDAEKTTRQLEEAQAKIAELEKNNVLSEVKAILGGAGLTEEDYKDFIGSFSGLDTDTAKASATALVKTLENAKTATDKKVREELMDSTKGGGDDGGSGNEKSDAEKSAEAYAKNRAEASKESNNILEQYTGGGN